MYACLWTISLGLVMQVVMLLRDISWQHILLVERNNLMALFCVTRDTNVIVIVIKGLHSVLPNFDSMLTSKVDPHLCLYSIRRKRLIWFSL